MLSWRIWCKLQAQIIAIWERFTWGRIKIDLNPVFDKHVKKFDAFSLKESTYTSDSFNLASFNFPSKTHKMHHYSKSERLDFCTNCYDGLPKEHWSELHDWCKSWNRFLSSGKLSHKFSSKQGRSNLKRKKQVLVFISKTDSYSWKKTGV